MPLEEPRGQKKPAGHGWQTALDFAPLKELYLPASHAVQSELAAAFAVPKVPAGQGFAVPLEEPRGQKKPRKHDRHAPVAAAGEPLHVPPSHGEHTPDDVAALIFPYVPAMHSVQVEFDVAPVLLLHVPTGHFVGGFSGSQK